MTRSTSLVKPRSKEETAVPSNNLAAPPKALPSLETPRNYSNVPEGAIPAEQAGFLSSDPENIMQMRWETRQLISQLWRGLANRTYAEIDGRAYLVPVGTKKDALMSDEGANELINLLLSKINPVIALSNLRMEDARMLWQQSMKSVLKVIVLEEERYGCKNVSKKRLIMSIVKDLMFSQLMRAVDGHESEMAATAINREHQQYDIDDRRKNPTAIPSMKERTNRRARSW